MRSSTRFSTLSLHAALPICHARGTRGCGRAGRAVLEAHGGARHGARRPGGGIDREQPPVRRNRKAVRGIREGRRARDRDRKSTRLNSSHVETSYAVFCLKKK